MDDFIVFKVGEGKVDILLQKNAFTSFLLPNSGKITLTKEDFKELFSVVQDATIS